MVAGDADEGSILVEVNTAENTDSCRISPGTDPQPWHSQFCCCSCGRPAGRVVRAAQEELGLPQPGLLCDEQAAQNRACRGSSSSPDRDTTGVGHWHCCRQCTSSALRSGQNVQLLPQNHRNGSFHGNWAESFPAPGTGTPLPWLLPCTAGCGVKLSLPPGSVELYEGTPWVPVGSSASPSSPLG